MLDWPPGSGRPWTCTIQEQSEELKWNCNILLSISLKLQIKEEMLKRRRCQSSIWSKTKTAKSKNISVEEFLLLGRKKLGIFYSETTQVPSELNCPHRNLGREKDRNCNHRSMIDIPIGINNFLKCTGKLVGNMICWRWLFCVQHLENCVHLWIAISCCSLQCILYLLTSPMNSNFKR